MGLEPTTFCMASVRGLVPRRRHPSPTGSVFRTEREGTCRQARRPGSLLLPLARTATARNLLRPRGDARFSHIASSIRAIELPTRVQLSASEGRAHGVIVCPPDKKTADFRRFLVELAGLEPATSWVRSERSRANLTQRLTHAALMHCSVPQTAWLAKPAPGLEPGTPSLGGKDE